MTLLLAASIDTLGPADSTGYRAAEPGALRRFAVRADVAGLDCLILRPPGDALIAAGWLITATRRVGLVCRISAAVSQPFHTARALAAMDTLSGGRMGWLPSAATDQPSSAFGHETAPPRDAAARASEYIAATQALWDSWDADALIIDKPSAVYLDSARIRRIDFRGRYFRVLGPLNAARPPQGYPVLIRNDGDHVIGSPQPADVMIVGAATPSEAQSRIATARAQGAVRILLNVRCTSTAAPVPPTAADSMASAARDSGAWPANAAAAPALVAVGQPARIAEQLVTWHRTLRCDGFHIDGDEDPERFAALLESLLPEVSRRRATGGIVHGTHGNVAATPTLRARLGLAIPVNRYSAP